jgi:hypothetical protein
MNSPPDFPPQYIRLALLGKDPLVKEAPDVWAQSRRTFLRREAMMSCFPKTIS